jgi:hypothetical protein
MMVKFGEVKELWEAWLAYCRISNVSEDVQTKARIFFTKIVEAIVEQEWPDIPRDEKGALDSNIELDEKAQAMFLCLWLFIEEVGLGRKNIGAITIGDTIKYWNHWKNYCESFKVGEEVAEKAQELRIKLVGAISKERMLSQQGNIAAGKISEDEELGPEAKKVFIEFANFIGKEYPN